MKVLTHGEIALGIEKMPRKARVTPKVARRKTQMSYKGLTQAGVNEFQKSVEYHLPSSERK